MYQLVDLSGRSIVVTGASSGIGRQTAITLSRLGARLILIARRKEKLEEVIAELEGTGHVYYPADLSVVEDIKALFQQICQEQGACDGMVYSAGVGTSIPVMQLVPEKLQRILDINFNAFVECVRQICKKGRFNKGMRIVGVSSIASLCGDKTHTGYAASKAAMDAAVRCIAQEVAPKEICINTVAPAMTATEMYEGFKTNYGGEDSESNQYLLRRQYLGIAQPEDIANAIAFLISPAARFITGITLPVDGGRTTS